jgi:hypothetical protein
MRFRAGWWTGPGASRRGECSDLRVEEPEVSVEHSDHPNVLLVAGGAVGEKVE